MVDLCRKFGLDVDSAIKQLLDYKNTPGKQVQLPETQIRQLCQVSREIFLQQPMLLECKVPMNIFGDIHGQYDDLLRHFDSLGYPPEANFLFMGDYVDRGKKSLETICLLLAYKVKYPDKFYLLRGNHESASINRIYGFYDECKRRYNIKLWKTFTDCFNCLPVAAVVEETIFCMHGGLSPDLQDLDQIRQLDRPLEVPDKGLVCDLLWSDPDEDITGWGDNDRGVSWTFGGDVLRETLEKYGFSLVARAHQMIGVGTKDADLAQYRSSFCSILGRDSESWGLSYFGTFHHDGKSREYTTKFDQGTTIGVHLDTWSGKLAFLKDGKCLGMAADGLRGKDLYPVVSSTAARTKMRLMRSTSIGFSLQYLCCAQIGKVLSDPSDIKTLPIPPGVKHFLMRELDWIFKVHTKPRHDSANNAKRKRRC